MYLNNHKDVIFSRNNENFTAYKNTSYISAFFRVVMYAITAILSLCLTILVVSISVAEISCLLRFARTKFPTIGAVNQERICSKMALLIFLRMEVIISISRNQSSDCRCYAG